MNEQSEYRDTGSKEKLLRQTHSLETKCSVRCYSDCCYSAASWLALYPGYFYLSSPEYVFQFSPNKYTHQRFVFACVETREEEPSRTYALSDTIGKKHQREVTALMSLTSKCLTIRMYYYRYSD